MKSILQPSTLSAFDMMDDGNDDDDLLPSLIQLATMPTEFNFSPTVYSDTDSNSSSFLSPDEIEPVLQSLDNFMHDNDANIGEMLELNDLDLENSIVQLLENESKNRNELESCDWIINSDTSSTISISQENNADENQLSLSKDSFENNNKTAANSSNDFQCLQCGQKFSNQSNLKAHGRVHTGEKPYKCEICNKCFSRSYGLKKHLQSHSRKEENPPCTTKESSKSAEVVVYKCPQCPKTFNLQEYLTSHLKSHSSSRQFLCSFCTKAFKHKSELNQHERIHRNDRRFSCSYCSKLFTTSSSKKTHERQHTGETPYECELCAKKFRTLPSFNEHKRVHSQEKPYACTKCPMKFPTSSYLTLHLKRHNGEYKYTCEICTLQFIRGNDFTRHLKIHLKSEQLRFKCSICEERFYTKTSLEAHVKIHG